MVKNEMVNILSQIVAQKKIEIAALYSAHDLSELRQHVRATPRSFYSDLANARAGGLPFFICEFKRKSPSEGWINAGADLQEQIIGYARAGAKAISVLTDTPFFGGTYDDLRAAAQILSPLGVARPLLLQKDFILDEIQVYLARQAGADLILLIAAILSPEQILHLKNIAESLGMGVLVEVHDAEELEAVQHLDFPVLGINNRDLKVFRTALNRVNVLRQQAGERYIISESGIHSYRDFMAVRHSDGFLIGTSLMRQGADSLHQLSRFRYILKACGIRVAADRTLPGADLVGINFSPVSKRRMPPQVLDTMDIPDHAVAVFYQNDFSEIQQILEKYPFQRVQLYAGDLTPEQVRSIRKKVILAARIRTRADITALHAYAPDVDLFILDGPEPGSGQSADPTLIPHDFPYPFLLAGGMRAGNLHRILQFDQCIGVDTASGIETEGLVDAAKVEVLRREMDALQQ